MARGMVRAAVRRADFQVKTARQGFFRTMGRVRALPYWFYGTKERLLVMFYIGVDLGQRVDPSAYAVVERFEPAVHSFDYARWCKVIEPLPDEYVVRSLRRISLGTPYTKVVDRLVEVSNDPRVKGNCRMVLDATGVGLPVVDMLKAAAPGCAIMPVVLTSGVEEHFDGKVWRVPKLELFARLQLLLEQKRLRISKQTRDAPALVRELLDVRGYEGRRRGRVRLGAEGVGEHDDLVMAVALAVWTGRKPKMGHQGPAYGGFMGRRILST